MIVPILTRENAWTALKAWADCIIREDGDRDHDAASNLTCEQTIAVARAMLAALPHLEASKPASDDKRPDWPLPSFDARDWAEAFRKTALKLGYSDMDEGWLITWFANALMRGFDECSAKQANDQGPKDG